jgi:glycine cleavage system H lipoate-binding protein
MVALFVVATIIVFFIIDYFVQRAEKRKRALQPVSSSAKARFVIPKNYLFGKGHVWVELLTGVSSPKGAVRTRVGLDDFVQKIVGRIDDISFAPSNDEIAKGDKLFTIRQGDKVLSFVSPVSGRVISFNEELLHSPDILRKKPYSDGWVAIVELSDLDEIKYLPKGTDAAQWLKDEIKRFRNFITAQAAQVSSRGVPSLAGATMMDGGIPVEGVMERSPQDTWKEFEISFLNG